MAEHQALQRRYEDAVCGRGAAEAGAAVGRPVLETGTGVKRVRFADEAAGVLAQPSPTRLATRGPPREPGAQLSASL
eukprot:2627215-Prorocentrum_lima.AAC.1